MAKEDKISGKIIETYAVLNEGANQKLIYASISWNDRAPRDEIRMVWTDRDGEEHIGKGIALSDIEMERLIEAYNRKVGGNFKKPVGPAKKETKSEDGVDFNAIFNESVAIGDMRSKGFATKDGFAVLGYRNGMTPNKLKSIYVRDEKVE